MYPVTDPKNKIRTPLRLNEEDMQIFKQTIAGNDMYLIGGLACPTCGALQAIKLESLPDKTIAWFLIFTCKHYNLPVPQIVSPQDEEKKAVTSELPSAAPSEPVEVIPQESQQHPE